MTAPSVGSYLPVGRGTCASEVRTVPIVHVRARPRDAPSSGWLVDLAATVAAAVDCPVSDVWCTWTRLDDQTTGERRGDRIVYVDVAMRASAPRLVDAALSAAARSAAAALDVPIEDVWARFQPVRSGEVFAGGRTLTWE